ncbi:MAG TPA: homoserine O-acetyltransferase [bacterium]|nr:homoserine O-acetyltransferase [bacterium]HPQ65287.1 homoserine O-acetyltransferase [bacterium]
MKSVAVSTRFFTFADSPRKRFLLQNGRRLGPVTLAYETYGELSPRRDNAILLFHALSGSQHAAGFNPSVPGVAPLWRKENHAGWWNGFIGPGKALDTRQFFVVCANYLGGCYGSTGPRSLNPRTGKPYAGSFPEIGASDIVDSQIRLLDHLGIQTLQAAVGGSLGGMLALNLAVRYPSRARTIVVLASGMRVPVLQRILNLEQIYAIEEDPNFRGGDYYGGPLPRQGLTLARMISHKTLVSLDTLSRRAKREIPHPSRDIRRYRIGHRVESYMLHQGKTFVRRFDANTYLRIVSAWQHYDLAAAAGAKNASAAVRRCRGQRFLIFSIDTDVCFYPEEQALLAAELGKAAIPYQHITVHSSKGHDAFLLEPSLFTPHLSFALQGKW